MLGSVPTEHDLVYAASFPGSDDGGDVNANFTSLIASAQLHGLDPAEYRRAAEQLLEQQTRCRGRVARAMTAVREGMTA
jgi:hypothetical protein